MINLKKPTGLEIFLFLIVSSLLLYGNAANGPFVWDDRFLITDNRYITSFLYLKDAFTHQLYFATSGVSNFYRPLQTFLLTVDFSFWAYNPLGYHLTSIFFHTLCAYLAYSIIFLLFSNVPTALMASFLFLIHPINNIVVNYISSRADSQAAYFMLLSLLLFFKHIPFQVAQQRKAKQPEPRGILYAGSLASFMLALCSKELGMIFPFFLLFTVLVFYQANSKTALRKTVPFFIVLAAYILLRRTVLNFASETGFVQPLSIRLLTTAESFTRLIGLLFAPFKIHAEKSVPLAVSLLEPRTFISVGVMASLIAAMVLARKVSKMCFFGLGWFFIFLIPVANIMPINSTMADHWMYLPSIGFYLAFIGGVGEVIKRLSPLWGRIVKIFAIVFGCSAVVMFVFLTVRLNRIWNDPVVFHQYVSKMLPKAFRPHNELGIIYLDRQMPDAAILELNKAIELKPGFDQAYANLGNAYLMKGDSMRALILREIADKKKPALQQAQEMKSYYETAILLNRRAIELTPENPKAYNNLGNAYLKLRRLDEAAAAYNKALSLNSQSAGVYNNLGIVYIRSGDSLAARKAWERALEIDPGFKMARDNLSSLR